VTTRPPPGLGGQSRRGSNDTQSLTPQLAAIVPAALTISTLGAVPLPPAIADTEEFPALTPRASKGITGPVIQAAQKRSLTPALKHGASQNRVKQEKLLGNLEMLAQKEGAGTKSAKAVGKMPVKDVQVPVGDVGSRVETTARPFPVLIKSLPAEQPKPRPQVLRISSTSPSKAMEPPPKSMSVVTSRAQSPDPTPTPTATPSTPTAASFGKKKPTTVERAEKKSKKAKKKELEMELKDALVGRTVENDRDDDTEDVGHSPIVGRKKKTKKPGQASVPASRATSLAVKKESEADADEKLIADAARVTDNRKGKVMDQSLDEDTKKTTPSEKKELAGEKDVTASRPSTSSSQTPTNAVGMASKTKTKREVTVPRSKQQSPRGNAATFTEKTRGGNPLGSVDQSNISSVWTAEDQVKAKELSKMLGIDLLEGNPFAKLGEDILQNVLSSSSSLGKLLSNTGHIRAADGSMLSILGAGAPSAASARSGNPSAQILKVPAWIPPVELSADLINMEIMPDEAQLLAEGKPSRRFIGRDNQIIWGRKADVPTTNGMGLGGRVVRTPGGLVLGNLSAGEEQKLVDLETRLKTAFLEGEFWHCKEKGEKQPIEKWSGSMGMKVNEVIQEMLYMELEKLRRKDEDFDDDDEDIDDEDEEEDSNKPRQEDGAWEPYGMSPTLASVVMGIAAPRGGFGLAGEATMSGQPGHARELVQDRADFAHRRVDEVMGKFFVGDISSNTRTHKPSTPKASNLNATNDDSDRSDTSDIFDSEETKPGFARFKRTEGMGIHRSLAPRDAYGHVALMGTESPEEIYRMWLEEKMECEALMARYNWMTKINGKVLEAALEDVRAGF
jgi:hypothetical protein